MPPIVLRNGTLYDGTGAQPVTGDLLIDGERIGDARECPISARVVDCTGLAVAPGFIDAHSHSDLQVLEDRREKVLQGVTTEVVGNCGFSAYPASADLKALHAFANGIFCGGDDWGWPTARAYLEAAKDSPTVNVSSLVGHGSLRIRVAGNRLGRLEKHEVEAMESILNEALTDGASGLSTGLMYAPGSSAPIEELEGLCRVVARHDKIYTTHLRSYFSGLVNAVEEQIELARRTGCRLQISHLQAVGAKNWPLQTRALDLIEKAHHEGIDVAFDCYPYVAGSTVLTQILPQWVLEGGIDGMLARLGERTERTRIAAETVAALELRWSDIYISAVGSEQNRGAIGRNLAELSELRSRAPVDVMIDLLVEERGSVNMLCFNQSEENLRQTLIHPLSIIISDGFYVRGRPHPRLHGTFPLLLGQFSREKSWLGLSEAIHKITDKPARRFGIRERGRLKPGYFADVTVFDPASIGSTATYDSPSLPPDGIRYVFRGGRSRELRR